MRRGESRQGHAPLKTLEKLKRHGLIGQKVVDYFPKENGATGLAKHPLVRQALNQERQEKLALRKQLGQAGPKKGKGKRSLKKK